MGGWVGGGRISRRAPRFARKCGESGRSHACVLVALRRWHRKCGSVDALLTEIAATSARHVAESPLITARCSATHRLLRAA